MLEEIQQGRNKTAHKIYVLALLCITIVIMPIQQLKKIFDFYRLYNRYVDTVSRGPSQQNELALSDLYPILARNPYVGTWESSIKRSQYLHQEQGKILVKTSFNHSQELNNYDVNVQIYDGFYRDNKYYDITINSGSIKVKERYQPGKVLYETVSPLISYCKQGYGFKLGTQKPFYINKLKFKIIVDYYENTTYVKALKMEVLISSEYSINIIGRQIFQYQETLHEVLLAFLLMIQFLTQGYGIYKLSQGILAQKECSTRFSKVGFLLSTSFDMSQAIALSYIGFLSAKKMVIFSLPVLTIWVIIVVIELRVIVLLFDQQFNENALKFSAKIYGLFTAVCLLSYLANFHFMYFIVISILAMSPQIYTNYMVGHKLKQNMKFFFIYILPRYACIPYIRLYRYNIFGFEPSFSLCCICLLILLLQIVLIIVQIKYGVRSILPRFLHPEELKYFFSDPQSQQDNCSICLVSLKEKGVMENVEFSEMKAIRGEQICNNIVLTPCRHKFHIQCLANSMKNKLQCPNCRTVLPPLEEYQ